MDGSVQGHHRLAMWTELLAEPNARPVCALRVNFADWAPLNQWRSPLALVSLLEFASVDPALDA